MARNFPIMPRSKHEAYTRTNTPMQRYDVSCACGWTGYADTREEAEEAHKAHVKEISE